MRLAYAIFPIAMTLAYIGMQRNGNMAMFLAISCVALAYWIEEHWVRAWYLWQIVMAILMYNLLVAFPGNYTAALHMQAMDYMVKLSAGIVIFIYATRIQINRYRGIFNAFCLFTLFECVVYAFQLNGYDLERISATVIGSTMIDMPRAGTLGNKNFFAAILAITMPLFFRKKWCRFLPVIILTLFMQHTTGGMVAAAAAITYYLWKTPDIKPDLRALLFVGMGFAFVVFVQFVDTISLDDFRRVTWWEILKSSPGWLWLGNGPGSYPMWGGAEHVHNDYFETFFEGGIPSIICVLGYVSTLFYHAYKQKYQIGIILFSCIFALLANAFVNYPLHLAPSGFISAFLLGMAYRWRTTLHTLT